MPAWLSDIFGPGSGGVSARRILPWILILPALIAMIGERMVAAGWLSPTGALVIAAILSSLALVRLVASWAQERNARYNACARLGAAEADKALLLGEIFHRVNNNLQQISSLISLEASAVEHEGANEAFRALSSRVLALASVHQRIIADPTISRVPLGDVLDTLCANIAARNVSQSRAIPIACRAEALHVSIESALSIGLVVNELVSKAVGRAALEMRKSAIRVDVSCSTSGHVVVEVSDAFAEELNPLLGESVGDQILRGLVRQLGGTLATSGGSALVSYPPTLREGEVDA